MGEFVKTLTLVWLAVMAWVVIIFGWPIIRPVAQAQAAAEAAPSDLAQVLRHFEKIFSSWAQHANLTLLTMLGIVWAVVWMAVKLTRIHVDNPRVIHYHGAWQGQELDRKMTPPLLEAPREEIRGKLPVKT